MLCSHQKIEAGGILLVAPTGKARVRMEQSRKVRLMGRPLMRPLDSRN